jgi:hypothetical protein
MQQEQQTEDTPSDVCKSTFILWDCALRDGKSRRQKRRAYCYVLSQYGGDGEMVWINCDVIAAKYKMG